MTASAHDGREATLGARRGLIAVVTLAYGYWHGASHGSLYVSVLDISDRDHPRSLNDAEVSFLDAQGAPLAQVESRRGAFSIAQPSSYACRDVEERALVSERGQQKWARCFERQSRWLIRWIRNVRYVDLTSGACALRKIPVSVSERADDWWLWWVPLPHVGGKPYTSFSVSIDVDRVRCAIRSRS